MTILDAPPVTFALEVRHVGTDSPRRARHWLAWILEAVAVSQDTIDTACLVISELTTNAVVHTDSPRILVSAEPVDAGLRLVVHDDQAGGDWQQPDGDEHGRGLMLVRALAEVTVDRHAGGCTVTALIRTGR